VRRTDGLTSARWVAIRSELLCYNFVSSPALLDCRSVELRALCNEVPRTPPGPEGSNGTGIASCAPDHPKFLAPKKVISGKYSVLSPLQPQRLPLAVGESSFSSARLRLAPIAESVFVFYSAPLGNL
jgi:hypothetical protein